MEPRDCNGKLQNLKNLKLSEIQPMVWFTAYYNNFYMSILSQNIH